MGVKRTPTPRLVLQIGRAYYWLSPLRPGWRLTKRSGKFYDIRADASGSVSCDCADATFRNRVCKHAKAIMQLGLLESGNDNHRIP